MSRGNAKLEVGQLVLTSTTPPGNLGIYAKDDSTIGVVGQLACVDPTTKAETYVVTSNANPTSGITIATIWNGSQAQYDAIAVKDDSTLYVIV